jgi:hypothetical protein
MALGVAVACGLAALAWRMTQPTQTPRANAAAANAADSRTTNATPQSNAVTPNATATNAPPIPHLDRKRADEMREAIRKLMAEAGPAWGAATDPTTSRPAPGAGGDYPEMPTSELRDDAGLTETGKYIQRRVREDLFPLAKQCYAAQLEKNPKLAGRFIMKFRIVGDRRIGGVVDSATMDDKGSTLVDPAFTTCMTESMMSVSFDAPPKGELSITYPIEFSPEDDDAGDGG